jgi:uncharacterized pyridoxamine 5'-phosphate oxidase family protein
MSIYPDDNDYNALRLFCEKSSRISARVVDDFLLNFAARHHGLEKKMNQYFAKYRHITSKFEKGAIDFFKSQFIIHRVFKQGGLIEKFLKNPALDHLRGEERDFLVQAQKAPWRFSYAEIEEKPAEDFFLMKDVFSGDKYLLFSKGTTDLNVGNNILLWFNLIGFNGYCWQSYGPMGAFQCFSPEDIFFFAMEKNADLSGEDEIYEDVENDPLPYLMLISGASYPRTFIKQDEMIHLMSEYDMKSLDTARLKKNFKSEYDSGIYRFTSMVTGSPPHFSQIFFNENEKILLFTAMTKTGFQKLIEEFNAFGYSFPDTPYLKVRPQMVLTAEEILKTKIVLNEYEGLFHEDEDPEVSKEVDKMNAFVKLVLEDINAGRQPDIEEAIRNTGVHPETAEDMVNMLTEKRDFFPETPPEKMKKVEKEKPDVRPGKGREPLNSIKSVYMAAKTIRDMEPWKMLYESDLFGVRMPDSDRIYFISVMGANGEFPALAAYIGYGGLFRFSKILNETENLPPENILTIPHLLISFTDREELDKKDIESIKKSGIYFNGKGMWPRLEEVVPGYMPVYPTGQSMKDLPVLLEQIADFLPRAMENPNQLFGPGKQADDILVRVPSTKMGKLSWKNSYEYPDPNLATEKFKMTYRIDLCEKISKLKVKKAIYQVDLVMMPTPVKDKQKLGYFPFLLLLLDKETGMIPGMTMLTPVPDLTSMHESVPQKLLEELLKLKFRPEKIEIRGKLLFSLVENALKKSWCMPVLTEQMPIMDEAIESLFRNIGS